MWKATECMYTVCFKTKHSTIIKMYLWAKPHMFLIILITEKYDYTLPIFSELMFVKTQVSHLSSSPLPTCPSHFSPISQELKELQIVSFTLYGLWDLLPCHSPFYYPVPQLDLQGPNSPTCAVVLLHPAPGFS